MIRGIVGRFFPRCLARARTEPSRIAFLYGAFAESPFPRPTQCEAKPLPACGSFRSRARVSPGPPARPHAKPRRTIPVHPGLGAAGEPRSGNKLPVCARIPRRFQKNRLFAATLPSLTGFPKSYAGESVPEMFGGRKPPRNVPSANEIRGLLQVPAGTADNSPAIHCRGGTGGRRQVPAGTTEGTGATILLSSLRDLEQTGPRPPAMNCRAIVCRPQGTFRMRGFGWRPQRDLPETRVPLPSPRGMPRPPLPSPTRWDFPRIPVSGRHRRLRGFVRLPVAASSRRARGPGFRRDFRSEPGRTGATL